MAQLFLNDLINLDTIDLTTIGQNGESKNCLDGFTSTYWKPGENISTFNVDTITEKLINFIAISNHNFNNADFISLDIYGSLNSDYSLPVLIGQITLADLQSGFNFKNIDSLGILYRYFIITANFIDIAADNFYIANISIGEILQLPNGIQPSYVNPILSAKVEIENNITMGGNFVGRSVTLQQYDFVIKQSNLIEQWIYTEWLDLFNYIKEKPFFYLWLESRPQDIVYSWTKGEIKPPIYDHQCLMSFNFSCNGFIENE